MSEGSEYYLDKVAVVTGGASGVGLALAETMLSYGAKQVVLADFIADGHFARHVRRMRGLYAERQETLLALLAGRAPWLEPTPVDAGMHLVAWLPPTCNDQHLAVRALDAGVVASALGALSLSPLSRGALLLGFAGFDGDAMSRALDVLGRVAREAGAAP